MNLLLYCTIATAIAFAIGRANRSGKLFWALLTAFGIGAIGAAIYNGSHPVEKKKVTVVTKTMPESSLAATIQFSDNIELDALPGETTILMETLTGQSLYRDNNIEVTSAASKYGQKAIRTQPIEALLNPGIKPEIQNDS